MYDMIPNFPNIPTTSCRGFGCVAKNQVVLYLNTKFCLAGINVISGIFLGIKIRYFVNGKFSILKTNRLLFVTLFCAILFDFIPHLTDYIVTQ
uniref:Uncharacterized protein n=1 Tax=Panagrolaimus sp. PS1159 TaxID=55785 RepID=A0AC35ETV2_9BILA